MTVKELMDFFSEELAKGHLRDDDVINILHYHEDCCFTITYINANTQCQYYWPIELNKKSNNKNQTK